MEPAIFGEKSKVSNENFSNESVSSKWDKNAASWAEQLSKGWDLFRDNFNNPAFLEFVGEIQGRVLDAGCGEGHNTRIFAGKGANMVGVDISPGMIEIAKDEEHKNPLGIRYEQASFSDLSIFRDGYFDAVLSTMALMDGPDFEGAVKEFFRVLGSGGKFVFNICHPCFMTRELEWIEDENGIPLKLAISNYFDKQPYVEEWKFSGTPEDDPAEPFEIIYFPRTMSEYLNAVLNAGFILKRVMEPKPSEEACARFPQFRRWREHASLFFYVYAIKP